MRSPRRRETSAQKRARKRAEWLAQKEAYVAANPNPFHEWRKYRVAMIEIVERALEVTGLQPTWRKDASRNPQPVTSRDLAIGYWAVICKSENKKNRGLNYGELNLCFEVCDGRTCHRAKAAALLAALVDLDLIRKVKNHSTANGRGAVYERLREGETNRDRPRRLPAQTRRPEEPQSQEAPAPDADDDPF